MPRNLFLDFEKAKIEVKKILDNTEDENGDEQLQTTDA